MPELRIDSADSSNLAGAMADFSVAAQDTDAAGDQKETRWQSENWSKNYGYYLKIPEFKKAVNTKVNWVVGAGFETDEETEMLLGTIKGNGKENFTSIMANQLRVAKLDGDSYAEIIRDKEGILANLKPLNPGTIISFQNAKGRFTRYEQVSKVMGGENKKFKVEEIFHLSHDRMADEIHGTSIIPALEENILMRNEAKADWKRVLHRNVDPLWIFHLDTDDTAEIAAFKAKNDKARANGENMYVPKGVVVPEVVATAANASLNPLSWIDQLNDAYYQAAGVPQIIMGNAKGFTDASGKIVYLAFEQDVKGEQGYAQDEILNQLNLEVEFNFPASLQQDTVSDTPSETDTVEEEPMEPASQPNDTTEELEGKK